MKAHERTAGVVRSLRDGRITIPVEFRRQLGLADDGLVQVSLEGQELHIRPVHPEEVDTGSSWLKELEELFAPVHKEAEQYTEEEINAAIDASIKGVR